MTREWCVTPIMTCGCHTHSEPLNSWCRNPHYFNTIANKTKIGKNKRKSSTELFSSLIVLDLARTCGKIATSAAALKVLPIESYVCMVLKYSGSREWRGYGGEYPLRVWFFDHKEQFVHFLKCNSWDSSTTQIAVIEILRLHFVSLRMTDRANLVFGVKIPRFRYTSDYWKRTHRKVNIK